MEFEKKFINTISKYKLFEKKDKVILALSGGKDSLVIAFLLKKFGYNFTAIHIDLNIGEYSKSSRKICEEFCKENEIHLEIYSFLEQINKLNTDLKGCKKKEIQITGCAMCGVFKKWILNKIAREKGAKVIITGHNLDDEIQTFLMNFFKGSPELSNNTGPKSKNISDKKFIPRVKPLYYRLEKEILEYTKIKKIPALVKKCPRSEDSYRVQIRNFLENRESKEKLNLIKSFEKIYDKKATKKESDLLYCINCGEPSRKKICKFCETFCGLKTNHN